MLNSLTEFHDITSTLRERLFVSVASPNWEHCFEHVCFILIVIIATHVIPFFDHTVMVITFSYSLFITTITHIADATIKRYLDSFVKWHGSMLYHWLFCIRQLLQVSDQVYHTVDENSLDTYKPVTFLVLSFVGHLIRSVFTSSKLSSFYISHSCPRVDGGLSSMLIIQPWLLWKHMLRKLHYQEI